MYNDVSAHSSIVDMFQPPRGPQTRYVYVYENKKKKKNDVKTWHPLDVVRKVGTVETQTHYSDTCTCTCRVYMVQELGEPYLLQYLGGMYLRKEGM